MTNDTMVKINFLLDYLDRLIKINSLDTNNNVSSKVDDVLNELHTYLIEKNNGSGECE